MRQLLVPLLAFGLLLVVFAIRKAMAGVKIAEAAFSQYEIEEALLTPTELLFHAALTKAVGNHFRLFAKVRLADIIKVKRGTGRSSWQSAFNAIQSKHVDFLAVDPNYMTIQFVVELDDRSHQKESRRNRDEFVDRALRGAGVPIFHFTAKASYSEQEIRNRLFEEAKSAAQQE